MDAISFLRDKCRFGCGDPHSDISKAWHEIERLRKDAERYRWMINMSNRDHAARLLTDKMNAQVAIDAAMLLTPNYN
jgi:hypothetical protein